MHNTCVCCGPACIYGPACMGRSLRDDATEFFLCIVTLLSWNPAAGRRHAPSLWNWHARACSGRGRGAALVTTPFANPAMSGTKTFVHKNPLQDGAGRGLEMSTPRQAEQSTFEFPTCIKLPLVQKEVREVLLYLIFYHEKSAWSHKPTRVKLCWLFTTAAP